MPVKVSVKFVGTQRKKTMYLPDHFNIQDKDKINALIKQNPFATVISQVNDSQPFISHLPLILDGDNLIGHMSRKNLHWQLFQKTPDCTVIFNGPHTYITPTWYKSGRDVPTWNYAVVHLHGTLELVEPFKEQLDILKKFSKVFDPQWPFHLPNDLRGENELTAAIVSFRFHIKKIEAKFKLSQNRPMEDFNGIMNGLAQRSDENSAGVLKLMRGIQK